MIGRMKNLILKWTNRSMILILRFEKMGSGTIRQVVHYAIKRGTPQMMVAARIDQVLIFLQFKNRKIYWPARF
ncbi:hypothetical protein HMPREF3052_05470 [Neisseria sp. HMSC056A03]|nr:hypothetical protein HMPREF3052_05470 [Neisseria sp. HMSC056A03]